MSARIFKASLFPSVGMKISIEIPKGIENLLFPGQKMPVGLVLECNSFYSIWDGDKIIGKFHSGVEILGFFSNGDEILTTGFLTQGCEKDWRFTSCRSDFYLI